MKRISHLHRIATPPLSCFIPQPIFSQQQPTSSVSMDFVRQATLGDEEGLQDQFFELADTIDESDDPIAKARVFLDALIQEIYAQTGTLLTIEEVCQLAINSLEALQIPEEKQELYAKAFELLLATDSETIQSTKKELEELLDKSLHNQKAGAHKHHKRKFPWKKIAIIGSAVITAAALSFVCPVASTAIGTGAAAIIRVSF